MTGKNWHACGGKSSERGRAVMTELIAFESVPMPVADAWVYIHGLVFMQAKFVDNIRFRRPSFLSSRPIDIRS